LRDNWGLFTIHPAAGVLFDFKGVTKGLIMVAEKNKTRRNSIKNRKRKSKKRYWEN
jgi:hypothetical protein